MSIFGKKISRGKQCSVFDCFNRGYNKENEFDTRLHFFKVPKRVLDNKNLRDRWCSLIKRQDGRDKFSLATVMVCSEHFLGPGIDINVSEKSGQWSLKPNVEPSVCSWTVSKKV